MNQDQKDKLAKFAEATESSVNALIRTVTLMGETIDTLSERVNSLEVEHGERLTSYLGEREITKDVTLVQALAEIIARIKNNEKLTDHTAGSIHDIGSVLRDALEIHSPADAPTNQPLGGIDEATKQEFLRLLSDHVRKTQ